MIKSYGERKAIINRSRDERTRYIPEVIPSFEPTKKVRVSKQSIRQRSGNSTSKRKVKVTLYDV